MDCFELLGIEPTKDKKTIRHAYALKAKKYNLETDTEQIQLLKDAYDRAMLYAKGSTVSITTNDIAGQGQAPDFYKPDAQDISQDVKDDVDIGSCIKEEEPKSEEVFYESESLWNNYGKMQYDMAKELPGIKKIEKGIYEGRSFSFQEGRKYVMSPEFLNNQFEDFFIDILVELLNKSSEKMGKFFLPFAFMYGWDKSGSSDEPFVKSFLEKENQDLIGSLLKKEEVTAFYVNAQRYYALAEAYEKGDNEKQYFFWSSLWQYGLNHDELPVVKVKNDFSFWEMLVVFLESHKNVLLRSYIELERWFNLSSEIKSSKKHIFKPVVDMIEKKSGFPIDIIQLMSANGQQITELRKKAHLSSYLEKSRISFSAFKHLYELYYFVPERTKEEQRVMELLQEYTEFEKYYWENVEQKFEEYEEA